jgi:hypothetical protein
MSGIVNKFNTITISISLTIQSLVVQLTHAHIRTSRSQNHITVNCASVSEVFTLRETLQCLVETAI